MLPDGMEVRLIANPDKFARVAELMGENTEGFSIRKKAQKSVAAVRRLSENLGQPQRLGEVGINRDDISEFVDYVFTFHSYQVEIILR